MGVWDRQPRREILIAARTRDQARIAFDFVVGFIRSRPEDEQAAFTIRRSPRLEVEYDGDGGGHFVRAIAADGKSALGSAPTLVLMDERGHWQADQGDALEHALLSGLGKRGERALIISTSAAFSDVTLGKTTNGTLGRSPALYKSFDILTEEIHP
jgi:phage terminase large subunit-like protein